MKIYDVGIGWASHIDEAFVRLLKEELKKRRILFFEVTCNTLPLILHGVQNRTLAFRSFLDRSSFDNPSWMVLATELQQRGCRVINNPYAVVRATSKADLYLLLKKGGLPLRKTFILPAGKMYSKQQLQSMINKLKTPFVLTPAVGGYDNDVVVNAHSVQDIEEFRERYRSEDCLVQEYVVPSVITGKTAWFRSLYVLGNVFPFWWDPQNHFYRKFGRSVEEMAIMKKIESSLKTIASITGLELFSTEITIDTIGMYVIIDYANHPIDLNSQENAGDALPEKSLQEIAEWIVKGLQESGR